MVVAVNDGLPADTKPLHHVRTSPSGRPSPRLPGPLWRNNWAWEVSFAFGIEEQGHDIC